MSVGGDYIIIYYSYYYYNVNYNHYSNLIDYVISEAVLLPADIEKRLERPDPLRMLALKLPNWQQPTADKAAVAERLAGSEAGRLNITYYQ